MKTRDDMDCSELVERVTEYLESALPADDATRFEAHAHECPGCAEIIAQFRAVVAQTGALRAEDAAAIEPARREQLLAVFRTWHKDSGAT